MAQKGHQRKKYPPDLTDEQWAILAPMIPPAKQNTQGGRPRKVDQGFRAHRSTGAEILRPYWLALLAEAHGTLGDLEAGLTVLTEALTHVDKIGERWYESELYRLKGELILLQQSSDNQAEAESCFHHALDIARLNKQCPSSYEPPPVSLGFGNSKANARKLMPSLHQSTIGSPKALIRLT